MPSWSRRRSGQRNVENAVMLGFFVYWCRGSLVSHMADVRKRRLCGTGSPQLQPIRNSDRPLD